MQKFIPLILLFVFIQSPTKAQDLVQVGKEFNIGTTPAEGVIYIYTGPYRTENQLVEEAMAADPSGQPWYKKLGSGTFTLEPREFDEDMVTLVAVLPGYVPAVKVFTYNKDLKKDILNLKLELTTRIFQLDAEPYDAFIYIDGEKVARPYPYTVHIGQNTSKTVEVKRSGYMTVAEVFYNQNGKPEPPGTIKTISLTTRVVQLETTPAEGSYIYVDGKEAGEGHAEIVLEEGNCAVVKVSKEGYVSKEMTFCNKEGSPEPPINEKVNLVDREVSIRVPDGATISVNGKEVGTGEYTLKLVKGSEARIEVEKKGFVTLYDHLIQR